MGYYKQIDNNMMRNWNRLCFLMAITVFYLTTGPSDMLVEACFGRTSFSVEDTTPATDNTSEVLCTDYWTDTEVLKLLIIEGVAGFVLLVLVIIIAAIVSTICIRSAVSKMGRQARVKFTKAGNSVVIGDDVHQLVEDRIRTYDNVVGEVKSKTNTNKTVYENPDVEIHSAEGEEILKNPVEIPANSQNEANDSVKGGDQLQVVCVEQTIRQEEGWEDNTIYVSSGVVAGL